MISLKSCSLSSLTHRAKAVLKTATPDSAARLAPGSLTLRARKVAAKAAVRDASLSSSRS